MEIGDKYSKEEADYRKSDNQDERCRVCVYRRPEGNKVYCQLVAGEIHPNDVCDYFAPK
jgi:hypothetical protein